jgi:hypothetical protein
MAASFVLLALYGERVGRLVLQPAEIEFRDDGPRLAVPDAEQRFDQAALDHLVDHAETRQHFERGGVRGGGPRHVHDVGLRLEHLDRQALPGERQRGDEADRPAARDEDGLQRCHCACVVLQAACGIRSCAQGGSHSRPQTLQCR